MIIGYAYVCADILNVGHINHLQACRELCDRLIVGVLTNQAVMEKKVEPIISFEDRLRTVQSLGCVDVVVAQEAYSPLPNATAMRVDILFESTSHAPEAIEEARKQICAYGGQVIVMPYYGVVSSSAIKRKIKKEWKDQNEEPK